MEEWTIYRLGDVINVLDYMRVPLSSKQREFRKGNYPYYGAQGIIDYVDSFLFDGEYLLIAEDGENLKSKKQNIAQIARGRYWVNNHAHIVESNGRCDIRYICYLLNQIDLSGYITGSAQPKLNQANLLAIELRLPCLEVQKRVSDFLATFDDKIELNNRINHNLEEQAQIVFDRIFNSDLTNNCLLSSIVDINPKRTLRKNEVARCIDMTYLNTAGSFPSGWEFKPYSGGMKFINGDTLMARITPCLENGKVAYINFLDKEETAFGSTEYIVFHAKEGYPNEMFYFLTRNKAFIEFATKNMNGSSGRQRVSGETIGNYIIPVLSEDDINELKTVSESTMKEILKNNLESRVLSEMRNTILPKLMSGELKINDLTC